MKALAAIVIFACGVCAGMLCVPRCTENGPGAPVLAVVRDTVLVERPRFVHSELVRTVEVPVVQVDTVMVSLPIEQRQYEGEGYTAWVSGWEPTLDSIELRRTIAQTSVAMAPSTVSGMGSLSLGLQAGVGLTPKGVQPYVGVGLCWRVKLF